MPFASFDLPSNVLVLTYQHVNFPQKNKIFVTKSPEEYEDEAINLRSLLNGERQWKSMSGAGKLPRFRFILKESVQPFCIQQKSN
jgi:hypothetical protein